MRDDLLDAQAAVDWAIAQFPALEKRLRSWLDANIDVEIEEQPPPATHDVIVAVEKEMMPRAFNVEVGALLNTIRSSLDILATALAYRYGVPKPDDAYFPVARDIYAFSAGDYKGAKFVKGLPETQRDIIKSLEPYEGGNDVLWSLHHLDIVRKHRRLVGVMVHPWRFSITGWGGRLREDFVTIKSETGWLNANNKTGLGLLAKGAPRYQMQLAPEIAINEICPLHRLPVTMALRKCASLADSVIKLFDDA